MSFAINCVTPQLSNPPSSKTFLQRFAPTPRPSHNTTPTESCTQRNPLHSTVSLSYSHGTLLFSAPPHWCHPLCRSIDLQFCVYHTPLRQMPRPYLHNRFSHTFIADDNHVRVRSMKEYTPISITKRRSPFVVGNSGGAKELPLISLLTQLQRELIIFCTHKARTRSEHFPNISHFSPAQF